MFNKSVIIILLSVFALNLPLRAGNRISDYRELPYQKYYNPESRQLDLQYVSFSRPNNKSKPYFAKYGFYRKITQYSYGLVLGTATFMTGFGLGESISSARMDDASGKFDFETPKFIGLAALNLGASFGVWWIGNSRNVKTSYLKTLMGAIIGTTFALVISGGSSSSAVSYSIWGAPLGALITHSFYREPVQKSSVRSTALITTENNRVYYTFPGLYVESDKGNLKRKVIKIRIFQLRL